MGEETPLGRGLRDRLSVSSARGELRKYLKRLWEILPLIASFSYASHEEVTATMVFCPQRGRLPLLLKKTYTDTGVIPYYPQSDLPLRRPGSGSTLVLDATEIGSV